MNDDRANWIFFAVFVFVVLVVTMRAFGKSDHETCFWQTCKLMDGVVACSDTGRGQFQDAVEAFKRDKRRGIVFNSECIKEGEKPILPWVRSGVFFMK